jgi:small-conductance mechanosensitive channel
VAIAWWLIRVVAAVGTAIERRVRTNAGDTPAAELEARGIRTQVHVMRRVLNVAIALLAIALVLTQFDVVRSVGVSLLASAGIAGVVLGLAAQKTLAGIFAGIHLTATQPIRIGDVVIVEGEWGVIEEVTLTFVIVKVWDERRLVVPITRFLDQAFQNWTMVSPELHGTVFFYVDWTFPVDRMRAELTRIVTGNPLWDGRTENVQVTETKEHTLEVRALVSAADASKLWDLRVEVRERIIRWLQDLEGGRYLPQMRVQAEDRALTPLRTRM